MRTAGLFGAFDPLRLEQLAARPAPAATYAEALARIATLDSGAGDALNPLCRTALLGHGGRTRTVIVLLHGLTNCPRQFAQLGARLHARGDSVLIPRLPYHGLADRLTDAPAALTAESLIAVADAAVDIAAGLGERVVVAGLSAGGIVAAWLAQTRANVRRAVVIAPNFSYPGGYGLTTPLTLLLLRLPDMQIWWNPLRKAAAGPPHAYPRFSTHALAQSVRLGLAVQRRAKRQAPAAAELTVVLNGGDPAVDNRATQAVMRAWRAQARPVVTYIFPRALHLLHDIIDPAQPAQRVDLVYPPLLELLAPAG